MIDTSLQTFISLGLSITPDAEVPVVKTAYDNLQKESSCLNKIDVNEMRILLDRLPSEQCTLPRLMIHEKCEMRNDFLPLVSDTLANAIPTQLIVGMNVLCKVVHSFTQRFFTIRSKKYRVEVSNILESLLKKIREKGFDAQCLTPIHTDLLCLIMVLGDSERALPLVSQKFTTAHAPAEFTESILAFFYYSGIVFSWNKKFEAAEKCFELVSFSPRLSQPSWIVVCALRKLMLIQLILHGRVPAGVKTVISSLTETRGTSDIGHMNVYSMLAEKYQKLQVSDFASIREGYKDVLSDDGNLGLVKIAELYMVRHLVIKMQSLYSVCTLDQMMRYAGVKVSKDEFQTTIRDAVLYLQSTGFNVSFVDEEQNIVKYEQVAFPSAFSSSVSVSEFEKRVSCILAKSRELEEKRKAIEENRKFQDTPEQVTSGGVMVDNDDSDDDDAM